MPNGNLYTDWGKLLYLQSADTTQHFLYTHYQKQNREDAQKKSYENSYPFIYYIEQGMSFFSQAEQSTLNIKPILTFYGFIFFIKACLLTVDPNYPESSSVLAHGVSTRKRKKQNYLYLKDEVKVQKNGLFSHFSDKMFHMKQLEGTKYKIEYLLKEIPEIADYFENWESKKLTIPIRTDYHSFIIPDEILDYYNMTSERFKDYLQSKVKIPLSITKNTSSLTFTINNRKWQNSEILPFRYNITEKGYFFTKNSKELSFFPEMIIHYLVLYHLSMIARYEIEWWSELIHHKPSIDYPLIVHYLQIATQKVPFLINQFLFQE